MASVLPNSLTSVDRIFAAAPEVGSHTTVTSALVSEHIGNVQARILARVAETYGVNSETVSAPALQSICTDITLYSIFSGVSALAKGLQEDTHPLLSRHKDAQKLLDMIVSGGAPLVTASGTVIGPTGDNAAVVVSGTSYNSTFNELDMEEQFQDPDNLSNIRNTINN